MDRDTPRSFTPLTCRTSKMDSSNMADTNNSNLNNKLIINELLCYLTCKFSKLSIGTLKCVITDFYTPEDISNAKEILVVSVDSLQNEKWQKPAKRKQSDNKARIEVDDIIGIYTFLDENLLLNKLPGFVVANVDNVPSTRVEEGDIRCVLNKLKIVEEKIDSIATPLLQINNNLDTTDTTREMNQMKGGRSTTSGRSWAEVAQFRSDVIDDTMQATASDTDDNRSAPDKDFTVKVNKKRRFVQSPQSKPAAQPAKPKTIIGSNAGSSLKAAKELRKKRIFCVSNVCSKTTSDELKNMLTENNIRVNNIFAAKSKSPDSVSFRVNIDAEDISKFVDEALWPSYIIVREWVFRENAEKKA